MDASFENVSKICSNIIERVKTKPVVGIICGSGLGKLADNVEDQIILKYKDIAGFPQSTVVGHDGNLIFGTMGGKHVVVMQGRFHMYEGFNPHHITMPIRVMQLLGVKTLLVSNAAGGLNRQFKPGDLVVVKDHIDTLGLAGRNPLVGHNDERFGPRFPAMSDAYDRGLRKLAHEISDELGFRELIHEGVYCFVGGPSYETAAESRMLLNLGCDVVGMSTVPEVIVARHAGMRVFAMSLVTNCCATDENEENVANHLEVLDLASRRAGTMQTLFTKMIETL